MTLQEGSQAAQDSILNSRYAQHLLDISDDILGEPTTNDNHYLRRFVMKQCRKSLSFRNQVANQFRNRALSESALTLPVIMTGDEQTQPPDSEIQNTSNAYMADYAYLEVTMTALIFGSNV